MNREIFPVWRPDPAVQILGTGFNQFISPLGIDGLAREAENGERLELLAVYAANPGTGQFGRFMRKCQSHYKTICVWVELNPNMGAILNRFGFSPETDIQPDGEAVSGWRWDRPISTV